MYGKAVHADLKAVQVAGVSSTDLRLFRDAYARGGWRGYWKARVQRLLAYSNRQSVSYFLGVGYVQTGNSDKAFFWLNRAVDQHSIWAPNIAVNPQLDPIRSDARFKALLRRMNLSM